MEQSLTLLIYIYQVVLCNSNKRNFERTKTKSSLVVSAPWEELNRFIRLHIGLLVVCSVSAGTMPYLFLFSAS